MGGGEFEFSPETLETKVLNRAEYIENAYESISNHLNQLCLEYQKQSLGAFESVKREILKKLVLEMRK